METSFTITTPDSKEIYGYHHTSTIPSDTVLILVHGLTGSMNQYLHLIVSRLVERAGINVIRFNQYHDVGQARRFHQTTISMHVADTRLVIEHARLLGYRKIFLAGHSLGGPVAITATRDDLHGLILWDPTFSPSVRLQKWESREEGIGPAFLELNFRVILGSEWIADAKSFPSSYEQLSRAKVPVCIVAAELGGLLEASQLYREALHFKCEFHTIKGASHSFPEATASEEVAARTISFIQSQNDGANASHSERPN
jgi:pimeloyl-ACP methyl ester carboxylesterase